MEFYTRVPQTLPHAKSCKLRVGLDIMGGSDLRWVWVPCFDRVRKCGIGVPTGLPAFDVSETHDQGQSLLYICLAHCPQECPQCVTADVPALVAFAALRRSQGGALGVVTSEGGALLGNLSVSDLRGLRPEHYGALALPVRKHPFFLCVLLLPCHTLP